MKRTQILYQSANQQVEHLAKEAHPNMVSEHARQQRRADLRKAAERMTNGYHSDPELTAFTVLDGDPISDVPG